MKKFFYKIASGHSKEWLITRPFLAMTTRAMVPPRIRGLKLFERQFQKMGTLAQGDTIVSNIFASSRLTVGQVNAIVKKMGGHEAVLRFLRGELMVSPIPSWREESGVINFSVTSDGAPGKQWIKRLEKKYFRLDDSARKLLTSTDFKSTSGVTTEVTVFKGTLFGAEDRSTKNIRGKADMLKLSPPNAEVACLIREKFTDVDIKAMGLTGIAVMHEPIGHSCTSPRYLLGVYRDTSDFIRHYRADNTRDLFCAYEAECDDWFSYMGFAFAVSEVSAGS